MKTAKVNGFAISPESVDFEFRRLARFYSSHGFSDEELRKSANELMDKALDQAIGARLLLDRATELDIPVSAAEVDAEVARVIEQIGGADNYARALAAQGVDEATFRKELEKGARVNKLVAQACEGVEEPSEDDIAAYYLQRKADFGGKTLVDVHGQIRELLRHEARGRAVQAFVAELKSAAKIEYSK